MQRLLSLFDQLIDQESDVPILLQTIRQTLAEQFDGRRPSQLFQCAERECLNGYATFDHFLSRISRCRGALWGYQTSYVTASANTSNPVTNEMIELWRMSNQVPIAYVNQIDAMIFPSRSRSRGQNWTGIEIDFLVEFHQEEATLTNKDLANRCSEHFHREITEAAIKGQLDRLRKVGRVARYRPHSIRWHQRIDDAPLGTETHRTVLEPQVNSRGHDPGEFHRGAA
jgi:hypothetical protein